MSTQLGSRPLALDYKICDCLSHLNPPRLDCCESLSPSTETLESQHFTRYDVFTSLVLVLVLAVLASALAGILGLERPGNSRRATCRVSEARPRYSIDYVIERTWSATCFSSPIPERSGILEHGISTMQACRTFRYHLTSS